MASPQLEIIVEPGQQDTIYYLPLSPKSRDSGEGLKIGVRMRITNKDPDPNHPPMEITGISFSFPGSTIDKIDMESVPEKNMVPEDGRLAFNQTANWLNGSFSINDVRYYNQVYLQAPAPRQMRIHVYCDGFTHAFAKTYNLAPLTGEPLLLPFSREDLADDEYIVTSAEHYYNGPPNGTQIFAHDISIQAAVKGKWSVTYNGSAGENKDIRSFGRPVRAQGHGVVAAVVTRGKPTRPKVIVVNRDLDREEADTELGPTMVDYRDNDYKNERNDKYYGTIRVAVDYGNLRVSYSHLRQNSVVVEEGDTVWPGRKLAESGNSGNTSGDPHLHMECSVLPGKTLRGMTFKNCWLLKTGDLPASFDWSKKVRVSAKGVCKESAAIRPFATTVVPPVQQRNPVEMEAIVGEVFGGVSQGGDGFVIINGKLTRVPPRGIKSQLLKAIVDLAAAEELTTAKAKIKFKSIAKAIQKATQKFDSEL